MEFIMSSSSSSSSSSNNKPMSLSDCVASMKARFGYDDNTARAVCQRMAMRADAKNKMMGGS